MDAHARFANLALLAAEDLAILREQGEGGAEAADLAILREQGEGGAEAAELTILREQGEGGAGGRIAASSASE